MRFGVVQAARLHLWQLFDMLQGCEVIMVSPDAQRRYGASYNNVIGGTTTDVTLDLNESSVDINREFNYSSLE